MTAAIAPDWIDRAGLASATERGVHRWPVRSRGIRPDVRRRHRPGRQRSSRRSPRATPRTSIERWPPRARPSRIGGGRIRLRPSARSSCSKLAEAMRANRDELAAIRTGQRAGALLAALVWFIFNIVGIAKQGFEVLQELVFPPGVPKALYILVSRSSWSRYFLVRPFSLIGPVVRQHARRPPDPGDASRSSAPRCSSRASSSSSCRSASLCSSPSPGSRSS